MIDKIAAGPIGRMHVQGDLDGRTGGHQFIKAFSQRGDLWLERIFVPVALDIDAVGVFTRITQFHAIRIVHRDDVKDARVAHRTGKVILRQQDFDDLPGHPPGLDLAGMGARMDMDRPARPGRNRVRGDGQLPDGAVLNAGADGIDGHIRTAPPELEIGEQIVIAIAPMISQALAQACRLFRIESALIRLTGFIIQWINRKRQGGSRLGPGKKRHEKEEGEEDRNQWVLIQYFHEQLQR